MVEISSVPDSEALPYVRWLFNLVKERNGIILIGNPALTVRSGKQHVAAEAKDSCALSSLKQRGWAEKRPIEIFNAPEVV